jgi:hypothetical protein
MPSAPLRFCAEPLCSAKVVHGRCAAHAVQQEHSRQNYAFRRLYRTAKWRHPVWGMRAIVLREEPLCPECEQQGRITATTDVHHTEKSTEENFFDRSILQALCAAHHSAHTARGE